MPLVDKAQLNFVICFAYFCFIFIFCVFYFYIALGWPSFVVECEWIWRAGQFTNTFRAPMGAWYSAIQQVIWHTIKIRVCNSSCDIVDRSLRYRSCIQTIGLNYRIMDMIIRMLQQEDKYNVQTLIRHCWARTHFDLLINVCFCIRKNILRKWIIQYISLFISMTVSTKRNRRPISSPKPIVSSIVMAGCYGWLLQWPNPHAR